MNRFSNIKNYRTFTHAYIDLCKQLVNEYEYESSPRGQKIREKLAVTWRLSHPRNRMLFVEERKWSVAYFIAETLWYFSGSERTDWISYYAPFWNAISNKGIANSAYGSRIFHENQRVGIRFSQWDYVRNLLQEDPDSRRAVIHIKTPSDEVSNDVPCTLALQFFIRNNQLHLHVTMRSTDIILGLAYDVPAFTFMQEVMALELGVELGEYIHTSGSLHVYEKHFDMAHSISKLDISDIDTYKMPNLSQDVRMQIDQILQLEKQVREYSLEQVVEHNTLLDTESVPTTNFHIDWIKVLLSHRAKTLKNDTLALQILKSTKSSCYSEHKK